MTISEVRIAQALLEEHFRQAIVEFQKTTEARVFSVSLQWRECSAADGVHSQLESVRLDVRL